MLIRIKDPKILVLCMSEGHNYPSSILLHIQATVCLCNYDGCNGLSVPTEDGMDTNKMVEIENIKIVTGDNRLKNITIDSMNSNGNINLYFKMNRNVLIACLAVFILRDIM